MFISKDRDHYMRLGMIGLGRMGANMVRRLLRGGHECVVFDRSPKAVEGLVQEKAIGAVVIGSASVRLDHSKLPAFGAVVARNR